MKQKVQRGHSTKLQQEQRKNHMFHLKCRNIKKMFSFLAAKEKTRPIYYQPNNFFVKSRQKITAKFFETIFIRLSLLIET